ncbi:MAG: hypothetical protein ACK50L_03155 [Bacteroidota bacterium]
MQNINNEDIFGLVNSLTKSEKAYFKKYSNQHVKGEKNDYIVLFEMFEKSNNDNTFNIEKEFQNLNIKNISRVKNYLHDVILKSLISYHAENSIDAEIREDLRKIEVLWDKSLHEQCSKLLLKTKKNISKYDKKIFLLEVLEWESKLIIEKPTLNDAYANLLLNRNHSIFTLQGIMQQVEYDFIGRSFTLGFQSKNRDLIGSDSVFLNNIQKYIVNCDEEFVEDGNLKMSYFLIATLYYISNNNYAKAREISDKLLKYLDKNENFIISNLTKYITIITNNVILNFDLNDFETAAQFVEIHKKIENKYLKFCSKEVRTVLNFDSIICNINLLIETNRENELFEFVSGLKEKIGDDYELSHLTRREALYYVSLSRCYFELNDFKQALFWLNKLFSNRKLESSYIYNDALIYELVIHYELGNYDYVENRIRSLKRYFKINNNNFEIDIVKILEKYLIDRMNKIELRALKNDIENDNVVQLFSTNFGKFSIKRWINKKASVL